MILYFLEVNTVDFTQICRAFDFIFLKYLFEQYLLLAKFR